MKKREQDFSGDKHTLTADQSAQIRALEGRDPDIQDIPPAPAHNWQHARQYYRPRKEAISIRLDADLLDWLRRKSDKYQVEINRILRASMEADQAR